MDQVYLRQNALIEPLFDQWYAWSYLLAPASSPMFVANAHVKLMQSFVASPQIHVAALQNPAMRGGPFLDLPAARAPEVKALLERTLARRAHILAFAEAIKAADKILAEEARGGSLEALYKKLPEALRGYVELVYDLRDNPQLRFFEGLLYRSRYHDPSSHGLRFSLMQPDARQFALSTPLLADPGTLLVEHPFASPALDDLYRMRRAPGSLDRIRGALGVTADDAALFRTFFTAEAPRRAPPFAGASPRLRYFGHACVLVEAPGVSLIFDPVVSYDTGGAPDRFTHADLPETIDYAVLTHNHQDHVMFEALLELRHRIKTIVVPRSSGGTTIDPSLKRILESVGFARVLEVGDLETMALEGGRLTALPFLGEHGDLDIRAKAAFHLELQGHTLLMMADSNNLDPALYAHLHGILGDVEAVFVGMECEGAPMSWLYGPLFTKPLVRKNDQARRFDGSDCDKATKIVELFHPRQVFVYAMGQEPWLRHVMNVVYTDESKAMVESNRFLAGCHEKGIRGERLFLKREIQL